MTCLLSDLMDHAMAARRQLTLHLTAVSLRELVERVVMPYRYGVDGKRHPVEVEVPASLAVVADRLRLEQVLSNLVSNASRYSEDGSPIRVSARSAGTEVFVTVSDRGCGLTPDEAQGIFDPLARRARQHGRGLGLGLALVKRIVELHGGRVSVKSDGPGQGSEFGFALTLAQAATRAADASNVSGDDAPERSSEGSAAVGLRVCLVDDDERTGAAVGELLEVAGCERTWVCTSAGEALALLERPETEVDVILTDIALAGRDDGCQLAREVRARAGAGCPGLVAFTGHDPRMEGDDRASAFDAIIIKPASIEEILSVLGAVVGKAGAG
jgi:CheY-like chemotaxis protein